MVHFHIGREDWDLVAPKSFKQFGHLGHDVIQPFLLFIGVKDMFDRFCVNGYVLFGEGFFKCYTVVNHVVFGSDGLLEA